VDQESVDLNKLRVALRQMDRGQLLIITERAIELVCGQQINALVAGMLQVPLVAESEHSATSLPEEVRKFFDLSLSGAYHESFDVNSKNCTEQSKGTDAFIAEFDRLIEKCMRTVAEGSLETAREPFELLFALLRHIDEEPDRIVFFADEAGSWQVPVDWEAVLPAYFRCLASVFSAEEFARQVDRAISDFCHYRRPQHLAAAAQVANAEQKAALARLPLR